MSTFNLKGSVLELCPARNVYRPLGTRHNCFSTTQTDRSFSRYVSLNSSAVIVVKKMEVELCREQLRGESGRFDIPQVAGTAR